MTVKVNLLTKEGFEKKPLGKFLRWMLSYGRYIIISVESIVLVVFFSRFIFDRKLADLNESIEQKKAIVVSASDLEKSIKSLQDDIDRVKKIDKNRDIYVKVVDKIKNLTPKDTSYQTVSFNDEKIELEGKTPNSNSFAYFLSVLKNEDELIEIDLSKVTKDNETGFIEFNLSAVIKTIRLQKEEELKKQKEIESQTTASQPNENDTAN